LTADDSVVHNNNDFWNMAFIGTFQLSLSQIPEETEEILQHIINSKEITASKFGEK
jgi:hypothetical protein